MNSAGHPDVIELQMAHAERNKVRAAYNRAERLVERRKMMQAWADYLGRLRAGGRDASRAGAAYLDSSTDRQLQGDRPSRHRSPRASESSHGTGPQLELFSRSQ